MDTLYLRKLVLCLLTLFFLKIGHTQNLTATILVLEKINSSSSSTCEIIVIDTLGNQQTIIPSNFFTQTGAHEKDLNIQLNLFADQGYKICSTTTYSYGNYNSIFNIWTRYVLCNGEGTAGTSVLAKQNKILIFPNPTSEQIYVVLNDPSLVGSNYSIVDILGKEILNGIVNNEMMYIAIEKLKSGTYYFKNSHIIDKAFMFIKN